MMNLYANDIASMLFVDGIYNFNTLNFGRGVGGRCTPPPVVFAIYSKNLQVTHT